MAEEAASRRSAVDLGGRVWLGSKPCKGGPTAPASGGCGLDRACFPAIVCHQAIDGKERLKCRQGSCQFFSLRHLCADSDHHPQNPVNAKLLPRLWGIDRRCPLRNGGNDVGSRTAPVRRRRGYDPGREPCTVRSLSAWRQIASRTATPTRCNRAIRDAPQSSGVTSTELGILNSSESARCCELAHTPAAGAGLDLPPRITQWRISWERVSILATGPTNVP